MKASDLERLIFSPFHTSKILHHFLSGAKSVDKNVIKLELIYIVLPFIYNNHVLSKLKNLNKNSKFSAFNSKGDFDVFISSINRKIVDYKEITNSALIVLSNQVDLEFNDFLKIETNIHFSNEKDKYLKPIYKSAYNLGVLLGKEQYLSVFKKLRITEL